MMMMDAPGGEGGNTHLTWGNVGLGFAFVVFDAVVSQVFGLGVGTPLVISAVRCIVQLGVMALVLQKIFETNNPWGVAGIAFLLNLMGTIEVVVNKSKMRFQYIWPVVFLSMALSAVPVSVIGSYFAMSVRPFWTPEQFVPIVGMLCGNAISAVVITLNFILKEFSENRDKIETYLAFGASRLEACQPVAKEALRLALTTPINQMSVLGIISIPGMMTGALLGGAPVAQAARLQMVIMFMIAAATALTAILVTVAIMLIVVDGGHKIRPERIDGRKHWIWRAREKGWNWMMAKVEEAWGRMRRKAKMGHDETENGERDRLLG